MGYTYSNTPVLSRIKIGENYTYLKDADVRAILDTFNNNIVTGTLLSTGELAEAGSKIPTEGAVKSYVDSQVGAIHNFDVVVDDSLPTASANTMYQIYLIPHAHGTGDVKDEYITVRSGSEGAYTYTWEKIGNTDLDLTGYLPKTATVAGVAFGADNAITVAELEAADALNLKALAHKDSVSTDLTDYATGITGASYTPAGNVSVTLSQTPTAINSTGTFTPAGSVTGTVVAEGNISATKANDGAFELSGSVSVDSVSVNLSKDNFLSGVKTAGTTPTFTEGTFTPASLSYSTSDAFAKAGVTVAMGSGADAETLIFTTAETGTASVISDFSGGTKDADQFNAGAMPTFNTAQAAVGVNSASGTASFTGDKFNLGFTGTSTSISASFNGTEGSVSVDGNYDKAGVQTASFDGTADTITPTLVKGNKTITVS